MTVAELTDLMSRVGQKPEGRKLMQERSVALFIEACIEEAKGEIKRLAR